MSVPEPIFRRAEPACLEVAEAEWAAAGLWTAVEHRLESSCVERCLREGADLAWAEAGCGDEVELAAVVE